jgi:transposase
MFHLGLEQDIERLRQAALLLEAENGRMAERIVELTRQLLQAKGQGADELQLRLMQLEEQLAKRNRALFGKSSEKRPSEASEPLPGGADAKAPRTGHGPRPQPQLPLVEVVHPLDEADKTCPSCGGALQEWKGQFEESEEVDVIERCFVLKKHKRQKYRCACNACVETAPAPVKLQEGARYSIDFAVEVAIGKYADHLPLERQARIFQREGLEVDSQTLWDQVNTLAQVVQPLHPRLHQTALQSPVVGADETRWELMKSRGQKPGDAGRWYAWTLCTSDIVYHRILETRSTEDARRVLGGYTGVVMADGYGVYKKLSKQDASFQLAACWAHVRRRFVEAQPHSPGPCEKAVDLIGDLYDVEREAPGLGEAEVAHRHALRQARSAKVLKELKDWAIEQRATTLPQSSLGTAISYMLELWSALSLFLKDGRIPLDNNAAERGLRGLVVGRKNHYGSRSRRGTEVASVFYSLIETCKLVGVEPKAYLRNAALSKLRDGVDYLLPHEVARAGPEPHPPPTL